ncbi:MAG: hypothetical protein JO235_09620 [Chroococcidiopsidaceae cyanobacterium CP_BM_RX_35]|nr:hypothetical protein [Chroococcidiopsidaceae cyanobacterium CP_BM_RX_35]
MTTPNVLDKLGRSQSIRAKKSSPSVKSYPSTCRYCRFYKPEGRRGGHCQQIEALVHGSWRACTLALPPFAVVPNAVGTRVSSSCSPLSH